MRARLLDVILVFVVIACASYIGFKLLGGKTSPTTANHTNATAPLVVSAPTTQPAQPEHRGFGAAQFFLLSFSSDGTSGIKPSATLKSLEREQTVSCANQTSEPLDASSVFESEVADRIAAGRLNVFYHSDFPCLQKGRDMIFYRASLEPSQPPITVLGSTKIETLYEITTSALSEGLATDLGVPLEVLRDHFTRGRIARTGKMNLFTFGALTKPPHQPALLKGFPRVTVLGAKSLNNWLQIRKAVVVIDVRSKPEASSSPLAAKFPVSLIPYGKSETSVAFNAAKTNQEYIKESFETAKLTKTRNEMDEAHGNNWGLVVVGADPRDARAIGALVSLQTAMPEATIGWYYDGAASFNAAVGEQ